MFFLQLFLSKSTSCSSVLKVKTKMDPDLPASLYSRVFIKLYLLRNPHNFKSPNQIFSRKCKMQMDPKHLFLSKFMGQMAKHTSLCVIKILPCQGSPAKHRKTSSFFLCHFFFWLLYKTQGLFRCPSRVYFSRTRYTWQSENSKVDNPLQMKCTITQQNKKKKIKQRLTNYQ